MSLILDALNRADKERNDQQPGPSLQASPPSSQETTASRGLWIAVFILLVLILLGLVFLLLSPAHTPTPVADKKYLSPDAAMQGEVESVKTESGAASASKPAKPAAITKAKLPSLKQQTTTAPTTKESVNESTGNKNTAAVAALYKRHKDEEASTKASRPPNTRSDRKSKPQQKTQLKPKPSGAEILQSIPLLAQRSTRFRESVPNIEYSLHVYNQDDGGGMVKLNGKLCRTGAQVAAELRLIAILEDSIVLDYRGTQFRLLALNSWMNFN